MSNSNSNNPVEKHAQMRAYIQHRQRVMESEARIDTKRSNSVTHSRFNTFKAREEDRRIQKENGRLLEKLINISKRRADLAPHLSRPSSTRRSSSYKDVSSSSSSISSYTFSSKQ